MPSKNTVSHVQYSTAAFCSSSKRSTAFRPAVSAPRRRATRRPRGQPRRRVRFHAGAASVHADRLEVSRFAFHQRAALERTGQYAIGGLPGALIKGPPTNRRSHTFPVPGVAAMARLVEAVVVGVRVVEHGVAVVEPFASSPKTPAGLLESMTFLSRTCRSESTRPAWCAPRCWRR